MNLNQVIIKVTEKKSIYCEECASKKQNRIICYWCHKMFCTMKCGKIHVHTCSSRKRLPIKNIKFDCKPFDWRTLKYPHSCQSKLHPIDKLNRAIYRCNTCNLYLCGNCARCTNHSQ